MSGMVSGSRFVGDLWRLFIPFPFHSSARRSSSFFLFSLSHSWFSPLTAISIIKAISIFSLRDFNSSMTTHMTVSIHSFTISDSLFPVKKTERAEFLKIRFAETIKKADFFLNGRSLTDFKGQERTARVERVKKTKPKIASSVLSSKKQKERRVRLQPVKEIEKPVKEIKNEALQKRREAARRALEDVKKNAVVEDNFKVMKELSILLGGGDSRRIFRVLGLHLKKDEDEDEE